MPPYPHTGYMMGQKTVVSQPTSIGYGVPKPPTPVNQNPLPQSSQGLMKYPPFSESKTFAAVDQGMGSIGQNMGSSIQGSDRKPTMTSLQYRQSQIQGILSRPYSASGEL